LHIEHSGLIAILSAPDSDTFYGAVMAVEPMIRYLTEADTRHVMSQLNPVAIAREVSVLHASGQARLPGEVCLRWQGRAGGEARSLNMPGGLSGRYNAVGTKVINACLGNVGQGLPRASGLTMLFDPATARIVSIMAAQHISAQRTAAVTVAAAAELLVESDLNVAVIGAGPLARSHIELLAGELPSCIQVTVYDQCADRAEQLCQDLAPGLREFSVKIRTAGSARAAIDGAGLIIPATTATTGYIEYGWLIPGCVVINVSLDDVLEETVRRADLVFVDDWELIAGDTKRLFGRMYRSGRLVGPSHKATLSARRVDAELGEVFVGKHPGRQQAGDIILVNPFGMAIHDIALAAEVHRIAERDGIGVLLPVV
jgi:ornithine cyclodeaminase/alanine dehydrogenase-like protein (mu-crystallin family)